jgi:hypothetical protein
MASAWLSQSWALWRRVVCGILTSFFGKLQELGVWQQILHGDTLDDQFSGMLAWIHSKIVVVLMAGNKNMDV